jgi:hypothetical protein
MKSLRFVLPVILMSFTTLALAQSDAPKSVAHSDAHNSSDQSAPSDAQKSFEKLKALAGSWVGQLTTFPKESSVDGKFAQFSLRVTSMGNALVHELSVSGRPDHPVTMFYLDGDRLLLTHYCDAGNRPRMAGKVSPDGKTLEFDFLDLAGSNHYGHMHHAVFTFIDANHHIEDWTWMAPGDKPTRVHFDLQRTNAGSGISGN